MNKKTLVFILGNLTAFGPFVTDFYLPCLPELTAYFSASASLIQVSLTSGMWGLAAGQLLIGPLTDKYGRKRPLLWCLLLFVLATIGCMLSTSIIPFIGFRLLQGLTGAGGLVISKVIIADSFSSACVCGRCRNDADSVSVDSEIRRNESLWNCVFEYSHAEYSSLGIVGLQGTG